MPIMAAADILAIEARMLRAWPAIESQRHGEWLMRFANGYSKRANSVTPMNAAADAADLTDRDLATIERAYQARGIAATIRMFPFAAPDLDARLHQRGYVLIDPTVAMIAPLQQPVDADARVTIMPRVTPSWASANAAAYGGEKSNDGHLFDILSRITQPAAFATLTHQNEDVAWGIAVADSGYAGLQDIVVKPSARGQKMGLALVRSLLAWAQEKGAHSAYLHRLASNTAAQKLYRHLGFSDGYGLHYRVKKHA
ncbi:MAG: GNAT family N-acetyltransferase [Beijerinckiaceae bacterium]